MDLYSASSCTPANAPMYGTRSQGILACVSIALTRKSFQNEDSNAESNICWCLQAEPKPCRPVPATALQGLDSTSWAMGLCHALTSAHRRPLEALPPCCRADLVFIAQQQQQQHQLTAHTLGRTSSQRLHSCQCTNRH